MDAQSPSPGAGLRWLPYLFAAGAVFFLVELTRFGAYLAAPAGRAQLEETLVKGGVTGNIGAILAVEAVIIFFFGLSAAVLHGAAYYGLKRLRAWGWVTAVIASAGWSIVLVGIPVLVLLLRRSTREAYGIS
ncbi:MAG TPA: hypothetical protein VJP81_00175 [Candidatus Dormibacteraeota bacterium]|nr:hypothetical protein [Candidatus Dormibacteraeota bacterium]